MKKKYIVKSNVLFNEIINKGQKKSNKYFSVYYININNEKKFGIAVGTKIGNAVTRNKIKRQIRNIIDCNFDLFLDYNYIVIAKKEILNIDFNTMNTELISLIKKGDNNEK